MTCAWVDVMTIMTIRRRTCFSLHKCCQRAKNKQFAHSTSSTVYNREIIVSMLLTT